MISCTFGMTCASIAVFLFHGSRSCGFFGSEKFNREATVRENTIRGILNLGTEREVGRRDSNVVPGGFP